MAAAAEEEAAAATAVEVEVAVALAVTLAVGLAVALEEALEAAMAVVEAVVEAKCVTLTAAASRPRSPATCTSTAPQILRPSWGRALQCLLPAWSTTLCSSTLLRASSTSSLSWCLPPSRRTWCTC
ncbi:hypothetical protein E2C01_090402 [Portunus trituberculatus]|uniref:Uncharacterized protein n=1 Tax=Portunus trituberculatus TaxID=210409 RepID=A0A5B7JLA5_PORTR|nr:hypothetical protein [Portunus trituberculatus]